MSDIFGYNRQSKPNVVFSSDEAKISVSGGGGGGQVLLGQSVKIEYAMQVMDIFEIGSRNIYWLGGRPQGAGQIAQLIGPADALSDSIEQMQLCNGGATMNFDLIKDCGTTAAAASGAKNRSVLCEGCVLTGKTWSVEVGQLSVVQSVTIKIAKVSENATAM